jgi:hypothetical protein
VRLQVGVLHRPPLPWLARLRHGAVCGWYQGLICDQFLTSGGLAKGQRLTKPRSLVRTSKQCRNTQQTNPTTGLHVRSLYNTVLYWHPAGAAPIL